MSGAARWCELRRGLLAPFEILQAGRAGPGDTGYARVVRVQLLVVVLLLSLFSPLILDGVRLAERTNESQVHIDRNGITITRGGPRAEEAEDDAPEEPPPKGQPSPPKKPRGSSVHVAGEELVQRYLPALLPSWLAIVAFYGSWVLTELFVYALFRDHVDALTDELARRNGLPVRQRPGPHRPPRVRIDLGWVRRRLMRQLLGALVFASGAPIFLLANLLPWSIDRIAYPLVVGSWGAYWLVVTTAAKSDAAWTTRASRAPFFRRGLRHLTTHVRGFRWWLPRLYERLWTRLTDKLDRAAELSEAQPLAFGGLTVMRILAALPVLSILLRPLVAVAATALGQARPEKVGEVEAA